jgi:hypothetical protein
MPLSFFGSKEFHAVGVCMDENENLAQEDLNGRVQYALGMVASGVWSIGGGNQELYPDSKRMVVANVAPVAWSISREIAHELGGKFSITSHKRCGGGGAQALNDDQVDFYTRGLAGQCYAEYGGQVEYNESPVQVGNSSVVANMSREPSDHHHRASRFVLSVGYGIAANELREFEHPQMGGHGDAFLTTMDWVARAIERKQLSEDQIVAFLGLTLDIADGIADNKISVDSIRIYDGGRLKGRESRLNKRIVENSVARVRNLYY